MSIGIRRSMELLIVAAQEPILDEVGMVGFGITATGLSARDASDVLHDVPARLGSLLADDILDEQESASSELNKSLRLEG